ncbi:hypothetical protein [Lewinella sp. 4G2]|uniref:hypothetical protein n=1 Tax=Lewinella sp. 4G2 TaxID=1803372 RepID=UPI0007B45EBD|nr:hypothetical protein [Lewinella sp. 4G2]OAV46277.1 hypothetical protein A3850_018650 [Lewinella sp. 4G2]
MRYLFFFLLTAALAACSSPEPVNTNDATSGPAEEISLPAPGISERPAITGEAEIDLTGLAEFPTQLQGCSCALTLDAPVDDFDSDYLFVFGYGRGDGVIGIDGQELQVRWDRQPQDLDSDVDEDVYVHEDDTYRVVTRLYEEGDTGFGGTMFSGSVRVIVKATGAYKQARITGDCSC